MIAMPWKSSNEVAQLRFCMSSSQGSRKQMSHRTRKDRKSGMRQSGTVRTRGIAPRPTIAESNVLNDKLLAFQIEKRSGVPIYLQISNFILELLERIPFSPGALLPSERIVCDRLGISKMTLRQAYGVLIQKGCLEAQRGVGTFVLGSRVEKKVSGILSFSEEVKASGGNPSSRLLSLGVRRPSPDAAAFLKLGPRECTFEIKRLRYANQRPLAIEIVQLPHDRFPGLENFIGKRNLFIR